MPTENRITIDADEVGTDNEPCPVVGVSNTQADPPEYILFMFDEEAGDFYLERNDQSTAGLGGICEIELRRESLKVSLAGGTAEAVGAEGIEVRLNLEDGSFARLREALHTMFSGSGILVDREQSQG